jgi:hypothetical protein
MDPSEPPKAPATKDDDQLHEAAEQRRKEAAERRPSEPVQMRSLDESNENEFNPSDPFFGDIDEKHKKQLVSLCKPGVLSMKTEDMNLGRETEFQLRLLRRLGEKNIVAQPVSVAPFDAFIRHDKISYEITELKAGELVARGADRCPQYLDPFLGSGPIERLRLEAKDASALAGNDWGPLQPDRPDGLRLLASTHGQLLLVATETLADALGDDRALARNLLRHHSTTQFFTNVLVVDDASALTRVVSLFGDVALVASFNLSGDLVTIEEHREPELRGDMLYSLGGVAETFTTREDFEEDTEARYEGARVTFSMIGREAKVLVLNAAPGSTVHVASLDDDNLYETLATKMSVHPRKAESSQNYLVPAELIDDFDTQTYCAAFAEESYGSDPELKRLREGLLDFLQKCDGTGPMWPGCDLRGRKVLEESLRGSGTHYWELPLDLGDVVGSEGLRIHRETYANLLGVAIFGQLRKATFVKRMGTVVAQYGDVVIDVADPANAPAVTMVDYETSAVRVQSQISRCLRLDWL